MGADRIIHGAGRGTIYADLSTGSPAVIRKLHGVFQERGIHMLDAPVSGGVIGAQRATLQVMVGGDEALFEKIRPVLQAIGNSVSYMGGIGCGTIAKLVHNMISRPAAWSSPKASRWASRRAWARQYNVPMPMAALAEQTMVEAMARGMADKDSTAPFLLQEERAGVKVRTS